MHDVTQLYAIHNSASAMSHSHSTTGTPVTGIGSFSPTIQSQSPRPATRRAESPDEENSPAALPKRQSDGPFHPRHLYALASQNSSTSSLNFSRPTASMPNASRNASPSLSISTQSPVVGGVHRHGRKHSQTQGAFEAFLPSAGAFSMNLDKALSASQIAAQAAMQHQSSHARQRSSTAPTPPLLDTSGSQSRRPSRGGPLSPPVLSVTEASAPREHGFGGTDYHNGLVGGHKNAAQAAANVVFPKSPLASPQLPATDFSHIHLQNEKPAKAEKPKVKLFSRPGKIGINKDKDGRSCALPSPSKMGSYTLGGLQRGNVSTTSLADTMSMSSAASMYSMANSSSATIRAADQPEKEKDGKKHHFLSRQKHKLSGKDDHHLPLSSSASNSRPADPNAPSSLYNFSLPPSPGPASTSFAKSMSGLDLRHGGRALREKKKEERSDALREGELSYQPGCEWPGPSSLGSSTMGSQLGSTISHGSFGYQSSMYGGEMQDLGKYGLNNMGPDDAWPFLKAKLLIIFEGEDLRLPVEDFNRLVSTHLQRCVAKRRPDTIIQDLRDLLSTGFSSLDQILRRTPDDRLIPHLVEMWLFTFTSILPYMQAVFLPLDLELSGHGALMTSDQARDFWGALPSSSNGVSEIPATQTLEVRRIVLTSYRDIVILPRFESLKTIFSRLSLENVALAIPSNEIISTSPDTFSGNRPSTAMSLDPSLASYGSQTTTLYGSGDGSENRSRAISNVSYNSSTSSNTGLGINMPPPPRPFSQLRERNEDSGNRVTETVGRMLQCMSVLASVGVGGGGDETNQRKMEELTRGLKLNWLGRGRMGRNRKGLVGARINRERGQSGGIMAS
ncbi:HbrB-like-domain-containing protein [Calycina marina]|uniref:HbrB-like-domain-containing protein n=1 Tax=Calycina marina TaxID=1763456 RepID=A0A9P8CC68_9HELO|nr:HbrB-like-domain-containing protein [Calycina marina]